MRPLDEYELRAFFIEDDRLVGRLDGWYCQPWAKTLSRRRCYGLGRARGGEAVISLHAWVTTVATKVARRQLRRQRAERRAAPWRGLLAAPGPSGWSARPARPPTSSTAVSASCRELLAGLPRRQREVLVLHYVADLERCKRLRTQAPVDITRRR